MLSLTERTETKQRLGNDSARILAPPQWRQRAAAAAICIASLIWIAALAMFGCLKDALPWCITLLAITGGAICTCNNAKRAFVPHQLNAANHQPVSFLEAAAFTFLATSVVLSSWIIYHLLSKPPLLTVKQQAVDIELMSLSDFQNRHNLLPGTREKTSVRKRTGALLTSAGTLSAHPQAAHMPPSPKEAKPGAANQPQLQTKPQLASVPKAGETKMFLLQPNATAESSMLHTAAAIASSAQSSKHPPTTNTASSKNNSHDDQPFMQEVAPPELVELIDNDGDKSLDIWQAGGRSEGGTGARSDLVAYLKEINKRIKSAWSPPRGEPWKTEVLFRIEKSGKLLSARIINSSGSAVADKAAVEAIIASAPFKAMPTGYQHNFLDLQYAFNYNVDELTELTGAQPH